MGTIITGIILGLAGLYVTIYFSAIIIKNLYFSLELKGLTERMRFKKRLQFAGMARHHMASGETGQAIGLFKKSFFLDHVYHHENLVSRSLEHNLNILADLIRLADVDSEALARLPALERLFEERGDHLKQLMDVRSSLSSAKNKSRSQRRPIPAWAMNEFKSREARIYRSLGDNKKEIQKEIQSVFDALSNRVNNTNSVTYH